MSSEGTKTQLKCSLKINNCNCLLKNISLLILLKNSIFFLFEKNGRMTFMK